MVDCPFCGAAGVLPHIIHIKFAAKVHNNFEKRCVKIQKGVYDTKGMFFLCTKWGVMHFVQDVRDMRIRVPVVRGTRYAKCVRFQYLWHSETYQIENWKLKSENYAARWKTRDESRETRDFIEHKDAKTQRKDLLNKEKNFVSSCLCVQFNPAGAANNSALCTLHSALEESSALLRTAFGWKFFKIIQLLFNFDFNSEQFPAKRFNNSALCTH